MDKKLKVLLASLLIASSAYAADKYSSNSLVGFEGGYSFVDAKYGATASLEEESFGVAGMKIGAEAENIRMFISARNAFIESDTAADYSSSYLYGLEFQYMFNMADFANFFIGANYGRLSLEFDDLDSKRREYTTDYMGGDVGFNFHLGESFDLELGARLMTLDDPEHTLDGEKYTFDDITTGYMSLIYKYQMD